MQLEPDGSVLEMIETTSRNEFEAWAESFGWNIDKTDEGDYRTMSTDAAWGS